MQPVYIGSTTPFSGKSMISLGIGLRLKDEKHRLGYMKPYGKLPVTTQHGTADEDALFFKEALELEDSIELISPVTLTYDLFSRQLNNQPCEDYSQKINTAYEQLSKDKDVFLIGGAGNLQDGVFMDVAPLKIIRMLNAKVILVDPYLEGACLDCILTGKELLKNRLLGVIINMVEPSNIEYVHQNIVPYLESKNIQTLGVIPVDKVLNSTSVKQLNGMLNGEIITAQDKTDKMVENLSIGAMAVDDALKYFSRKRNKAVITGGDRPDMQLAALETSTSCLILTGHYRPNEIITAKAEAQGVPIILAKGDTFSTIETLENAIGKIRIREDIKVKRAREIISNHLNIKMLYEKIGLSK